MILLEFSIEYPHPQRYKLSERDFVPPIMCIATTLIALFFLLWPLNVDYMEGK